MRLKIFEITLIPHTFLIKMKKYILTFYDEGMCVEKDTSRQYNVEIKFTGFK